MEIGEYQKRTEKFVESLNREMYLYYSGRKERLDFGALASEYSDLFSLASIHEIEGELARTSPSHESRRKSLARLRRLAIEHHFSVGVAGLSEEISDFESRRRVAWDGREITLAQLPLILAQEEDAGRRRSLGRLQAEAEREMETLRMERVDRIRGESARLGYSSYLEAWQSCTGVCFTDLADQLDQVISHTAANYHERMTNSLESTLKILRNEVRPCDLGFWKRQNERWGFIPRDSLVPIVEESFLRLGLRPEAAGRITLDLEMRPLKQPRPFCIPVRIPEEIVIVLLPDGEYDSHSALLHESGHAHHFAWTSPDLPVEYRVCGDRSLSEAYAFLFQDLMHDEVWLEETFGVRPPGELLRFQAVYRAYMIRRFMGKLRFETVLYGSGISGNASEIYAELLTSATGIEHDPALYLEDITEGFYSADYLRAWIFEIMLRDYLRSKHGRDWYRTRSAGNFLKEVWETGQLYSSDELSREIGLGPLNAEALHDAIAEGLRR